MGVCAELTHNILDILDWRCGSWVRKYEHRVCAKTVGEGMSDMYEKIAARAYEIWEQEGRPDNKAEEHWLRAEREIADTREESRKRVSPPSVVVAAIPEGSVDTLGCCGAAKRKRERKPRGVAPGDCGEPKAPC